MWWQWLVILQQVVFVVLACTSITEYRAWLPFQLFSYLYFFCYSQLSFCRQYLPTPFPR